MTRLYDDPKLRAEIDREAAARAAMSPAAINLLRRIVEHFEATGEVFSRAADKDREPAVYLRRMALVSLQSVARGARAVGLSPGVHAAHALYQAYRIPFWERGDATHRSARLGTTILRVSTDGDPAGGRWRWHVEDGVPTHCGGGDLTLAAAKSAALACAARVLAAHAAAARSALQEVG